MTRSEAQTAIDEIDAILNSGVQTATIGDKTVTYNFAALNKRRGQLQQYLNGGGSVRVGRYNESWSA
jgi:hypothetical protein